jgi:hypothetical protein
MNVFVLNSGRCGSSTFIAACRHIHNYSAGHESRVHRIGADRLAYPDRHIEADNRLSWLLGRLERAYGPSAFYVHLTRDRDATAASFARRMDFGIMRAYRDGLLLGGEPGQADLDLAHDYLETVDANIAFFLRDKTRTLSLRLEHAHEDFRQFWKAISAEGNLEAALAEWDRRYNASDP